MFSLSGGGAVVSNSHTREKGKGEERSARLPRVMLLQGGKGRGVLVPEGKKGKIRYRLSAVKGGRASFSPVRRTSGKYLGREGHSLHYHS